jgi:uncharacterized protein YecE (DUF72 family)
MEFGKLEDISNVDWELPADDPTNASRVLGKGDLRLRIGSPSWGNKHWRGKIYPKDAKDEEFLFHYTRSFTTIELNTTHYRIPNEATARSWLSQADRDFKFCPKLHKGISHERFGLVDKVLLKEWLTFLEVMKFNLGPCFIQLHEKFSYEEKHLLFRFLENWPSEFKLSLELRHPSWFRQGTVLGPLADYMFKKKIGLVITDVAGRRDVLHSTISAPWVLLRLIGNDLHPSDERRVEDWAHRLLSWKKNGLEEAYLFLHQPDEIWTIEFVRKAMPILSARGFSVPAFESYQELDLFNF